MTINAIFTNKYKLTYFKNDKHYEDIFGFGFTITPFFLQRP